MMLISAALVLAALALPSAMAASRPPVVWTLARSGLFEIYSDAGEHSARALLSAFESMRAFFARTAGVSPAPQRPVRIISFASRQEYDTYRINPTADAFYVGEEAGDYIVMPAFVPGDFHIAAHEYAHLLIHASGLALPHWIAEGIAEVASTVRIGARESSIGGGLPARAQLLRTTQFMPLSDLCAMTETDSGGRALFYAQSWALTSLLMLSPEYGPRFRLLLGSLASGVGTETALRTVYRTSLDELTRKLHAWVARIPAPVPLPGMEAPAPPAQVGPISSFDARAMMAGLRLASGDLDRAEGLYRVLATESRSAEAHAALGLIALHKNHAADALAAWRQAMELGLADPGLCYRYAVLADHHGLGIDQVRSALKRAIALQPAFDDARFALALLEKNAGNPQAAIDHLRAMRTISPVRAFSYWAAMADALLELGRRDESRAAAAAARDHAASDAERDHAQQLIYMADTELSVQLTSGADGRPHFQAIRVPHGQPPRNPFIEPGDAVQRSEGVLREIECAEEGVRVLVSNQSGGLTLSVPDPSRVQIRNTPGVSFEFTCGAQTPRKVVVEYTATRVLRGLELQ